MIDITGANATALATAVLAMSIALTAGAPLAATSAADALLSSVDQGGTRTVVLLPPNVQLAVRALLAAVTRARSSDQDPQRLALLTDLQQAASLLVSPPASVWTAPSTADDLLRLDGSLDRLLASQLPSAGVPASDAAISAIRNLKSVVTALRA